MAVFEAGKLNEKEHADRERFLGLLHHANRRGRVMLLRKDPVSNTVEQGNTGDMADIIQAKNDGRDTYVSVNTFTGKSRRAEDCFALGTIFLDLDIHDDDAECRETVKALSLHVLEEAFANGELPVPTMITDSGRGFGLFYVLERSIAAQSGRNALQVRLFRAIRQRLYEKVKQIVERHQISLNTDPSVLSDAQVARLPGTPNTKARRDCELISSSGRFYKLSELIDEGKLWEKRESRKSGKKSTGDSGRDLRGCLEKRVEMLEALRDLRGGECTDCCRELMCFIVYSSLIQLDRRTAVGKLRTYNNSFVEPIGQEELDHIIAGAAANVQKDGSVGYYRLPNSYIANVLDITPEEKKQIGFADSLKRELARQETAMRKDVRDRLVCECLSAEEHMTYFEIAEKTGVSLRTVRRIAKKFGMNRHPVKVTEKRAKICIESVCAGNKNRQGAEGAEPAPAGKLADLLKIVPADGGEGRVLRTAIRKAKMTLSETPDRPLSARLDGMIAKTLDTVPGRLDPDDALAVAEALESEIIERPVYVPETVMERMKSGRNVFVTGFAGTGKSTVVSEYTRACEEAGKTVYRLAPTGAAAFLIAGKTVHSMLHIDAAKDLTSTIRADQIAAFEKADIVVIDEIGMLRTDLFEYVMRIINAAQHAYGKHIQVIASGDFCQIQPVITDEERDSFEAAYPGYEGYAFESPMWTECGFSSDPIALTKIRRQSDRRFSEKLAQIALGDRSAVRWMNRSLKVDASETDDTAVYLCGYRKTADRINERFVDRRRKDPTFRTFEGSGFAEGKKYPVPERVSVCVGMPVMTVINTDRYSNGTRGYVSSVDENGIIMATADKRVIRVSVCGISDHEGGTVRQLPVVPAYALTVHKAQGQTLDRVILDPRSFAPGQLYTALSRVRDPEKLTLTREICEKDLIVSESAVRYETELFVKAERETA